jgi:hypothetical protein
MTSRQLGYTSECPTIQAESSEVQKAARVPLSFNENSFGPNPQMRVLY